MKRRRNVLLLFVIFVPRCARSTHTHAHISRCSFDVCLTLTRTFMFDMSTTVDVTFSDVAFSSVLLAVRVDSPSTVFASVLNEVVAFAANPPALASAPAALVVVAEASPCRVRDASAVRGGKNLVIVLWQGCCSRAIRRGKEAS